MFEYVRFLNTIMSTQFNTKKRTEWATCENLTSLPTVSVEKAIVDRAWNESPFIRSLENIVSLTCL